MYANQHFVSSGTSPYKPFHSNNMDFTLGGPIIPHHNSFFFFAVEPLRQSSSAGGGVTFAAPEFIAFAQANYPDTVGTHILNTYQPVGVGDVSVSQTAQDSFRQGRGWQFDLRDRSRPKRRTLRFARDRHKARLAQPLFEMAPSISPALTRDSKMTASTSASSAPCFDMEHRRRCHSFLL